MEGTPKIDKKFFVGLPIPPAGGLLAALVHFAPMPLSSYGKVGSHYYTYAILALVGLLSILMVSTIRYTSMKSVGKGRQGLFLVLAIIAMAMFVWFYSEYALLGIAAIYVSHGLIWLIFRSIGRISRPSKADPSAS